MLVSSSAGRDLKRLQKILGSDRFSRLDAKIQDLADDPRPVGHESLEGMPNAYRVRDGDYRVIYVIDDAARQVKVGRVFFCRTL